MLCISLGKTTPEVISGTAEFASLVEVRLDLNDFSKNEIADVFSSSSNLIATFRPGKTVEKERVNSLITAVENGAAYLDIGYKTNPEILKKFVRISGERNCKIILSYHNYQKTPSLQFLEKIKKSMFRSGADIAKIACTVNSNEDTIRILSLLDLKGDTIAIGMGNRCRITRIAGWFMGSPITYTSVGEVITAKGQVDYFKMQKIIEMLKTT